MTLHISQFEAALPDLCREMGISFSALMTLKKGSQHLAHERHLLMHTARLGTTAGSVIIGRLFNRDHSSVLYASKRVANDPLIGKLLAALKEHAPPRAIEIREPLPAPKPAKPEKPKPEPKPKAEAWHPQDKDFKATNKNTPMNRALAMLHTPEPPSNEFIMRQTGLKFDQLMAIFDGERKAGRL